MKKGLGRGLESLFAVYNTEEDEKNVSRETFTQQLDKAINNTSENLVKDGVLEVNVGEIDPNKNQPRKNFDKEALNDLAESIKVHGVVQPIIVVKKGPRYMIIAGERRWRATKIAGLKTIPAILKDYTERQVREISIIENLQREDLNAVETAKAIKELMDEYNWTQEVVSKRLGKSRSAIANTVRLLNLEKEVLDMIQAGELSAGHARSLVVVTDKKAQIRLAKLACSKKITVRDMEKAIKGKSSTVKRIKVQQSMELKDFVNQMQKKFSTKVIVNGNDVKGKIVIDYYNKDDLERIYTLVGKIKA